MRISHLYITKILIISLSASLQLGFFAVTIYSAICSLSGSTMYFERLISTYLPITTIIVFIFCLVLALAIICKEENSSYKSAWLALVLLAPIFALPLYVTIGRKKLSNKILSNLNRIDNKAKNALSFNKEHQKDIIIFEELCTKNICALASNNGEHPLYSNSKTTYYNSGEQLMDAMLDAIKQASRFIFLEFFIFEEGEFLSKLVDLLIQKVKSGVQVKIIYDDFGCKGKLKRKTLKTLKKASIDIQCFNSISRSFNMSIRDHRKLVIIDGTKAFCGGINVSDKYVNITHPLHHWRDDGILIEGAAAYAFLVMFLCHYEMILGKDCIDFDCYKPTKQSNFNESIGIVQPISDGIDSKKRLLKSTLLALIHSANKTLYISTPYLLLDDELLGAILIKAQSGVDVQILVPHIPDKKLVFKMTKAFCKRLAQNNVKIYEYSLGFNHAKCVIIDSKICYLGSCNFDYRSFYLNYECGVLLYYDSTILKIEDSLKTAISESELKPFDPVYNGFFKNILQGLLRLFAQFF